MKNKDFKKKYFKYKAKYFKLLNKMDNAHYNSHFYKNEDYDPENKYLVFKTNDNNRFSFKEDYPENIKNYETTNNAKRKQKDKILYIRTIDDFDNFTNKYGSMGTKDKRPCYIYINWDKVANNFKGFYLDVKNENLHMMRFDKAILRNKFRLKSWWSYEYDKMTHNIMIFE